MSATFAADYSTSQARLDGREDVTHYDAETHTGNLIHNAIRYPVSLRELQASYGVYTASDVIWTLGVSELGGIEPKPRDQLYDASNNVFIILDAAYGPVGKFWKLTTRIRSIIATLADSIDVEKPTITQAAGGRTVTWAAISGQTSVACRIQPREADVFDDRGVRSTATIYDVILGQEISAVDTNGNFARLKWGSVYLEITSYKQSERIDVLPIAECRRVP